MLLQRKVVSAVFHVLHCGQSRACSKARPDTTSLALHWKFLDQNFLWLKECSGLPDSQNIKAILRAMFFDVLCPFLGSAWEKTFKSWLTSLLFQLFFVFISSNKLGHTLAGQCSVTLSYARPSPCFTSLFETKSIIIFCLSYLMCCL